MKPTLGTDDVWSSSVSLGCRALRSPAPHWIPSSGPNPPPPPPRPRLPFHSDPLRNSLPRRAVQTDAQLARAKCPCGLQRGDVLRADPLLSWGGTPAQAPTQIDSEESRKLTLSREREEEEGPQPGVSGASAKQPRRQRLASGSVWGPGENPPRIS